ncbi:MAG: tetratricopeptide repeat protein [Saprospiraceae bacterium]|nr:tetratricopeptide repeat protein [Saprospiraceae bacterium]
MISPQVNPTWFIDQLALYQNANSSPEAVKRNFLARIAEFELIVAGLRNKGPKDPLQHELILGWRGSGKSTLLRRIQIEIDEDADLAARYVAIYLAEEQNTIYRLSDLWFEVVQELAIRLNRQLNLSPFDNFDSEQDYSRYLYAQIATLLQESGKRTVLLLDNIDRIFENIGDDGHLMREILINYRDMQIIGASTRISEHFWRYDLPFFDFFRAHHLKGLSFEEIHHLLNHWSTEMNLPQLHNYALHHRGRVEAMRILTNGLPRALQFFVQILLHDSSLYGFEYLRKIMDNATPLYQERLHNLTAAQRKIVQEMAFWWEAVPTKVLAEKCRMESKLIASYLKQLEQYGIVEIIPTGKKNHLYRLAERFFNMWLIVTQGNPDQKRCAKYLTVFLETWYDAKDIQFLVQQQLELLKSGEFPYDKAWVMSKALSQSKFIGVKERDELIDFTRQMHPEASQNSELPRKFQEIMEDAMRMADQGHVHQAIKMLNEEIENEARGSKFYLLVSLYLKQGDEKKINDCYQKILQTGDAAMLNATAFLYINYGRLPDAEQLYLAAIEKEDVNALYNLAILYHEQKEMKKAESYYLKAIEKGYSGAINNLAFILDEQGKQDEAERYYLLAISGGQVAAIYNLANHYQKTGKLYEAEKYYLQAIEKGHVWAMYNLANLYSAQRKFAEAEHFYLMAKEKGEEWSLHNLAGLYYETNQKPENALDYERQHLEKTEFEPQLSFFALLEIWNGIFDDLDKKIARVIQQEKDGDLTWFLTNLLYHEQRQLVLSLFESEAHGRALRERYTPLYYATRILAGKTEDNLLLRIPPELMPTVQEIVARVKEKQAFYAAPPA